MFTLTTSSLSLGLLTSATNLSLSCISTSGATTSAGPGHALSTQLL